MLHTFLFLDTGGNGEGLIMARPGSDLGPSSTGVLTCCNIIPVQARVY
jgi:hypothetical protein